jgi:hypothetical protein
MCKGRDACDLGLSDFWSLNCLLVREFGGLTSSAVFLFPTLYSLLFALYLLRNVTFEPTTYQPTFIFPSHTPFGQSKQLAERRTSSQ